MSVEMIGVAAVVVLVVGFVWLRKQ